jgi:hypothetical protein
MSNPDHEAVILQVTWWLLRLRGSPKSHETDAERVEEGAATVTDISRFPENFIAIFDEQPSKQAQKDLPKYLATLPKLTCRECDQTILPADLGLVIGFVADCTLSTICAACTPAVTARLATLSPGDDLQSMLRPNWRPVLH